MKNTITRYLPLLSMASLFGCGDDTIQRTQLLDFSINSPFLVQTNSGNTVQIGHDAPEPPPVVTDPSAGARLGMQGDLALCADDSSLSNDQRAKVADLKRRLNEIIQRLVDNQTKILFAGEKNTIKATPNCQAFEDEIQDLGALLLTPITKPTPKPPQGKEGTLNNIRFSDEGHGWLVMDMELANGDFARFSTGVKTENAEQILRSRLYTIETGITENLMALRFSLQNSETESRRDESTESCSETRYRTVCHYNRETKKDECRQEAYTVYGYRNVVRTTTDDTYDYTVQFLSANQNEVKGTAKLKTTVTKFYRNYGYCMITDHYGNNPFPYPFPGGEPGHHGPHH